MDRSAFVRLLIGLVGLLSACSPAERPGRPPRHAVIVSFSGMRPDHMSAYLYTRPTTGWPATPTPRADGSGFSIDDLAASGVLFANAYAPSPLDVPSAATLHLGRAPWEHGVLDEVGALPSDLRTLAERFGDAGFQTTALVAGAALTELGGLERGFNEFASGLSDAEVLERAKLWTQSDFEEPHFLWLHFGGPTWGYAAGVVPERLPTLPFESEARDEWDLGTAFVDLEWKGSSDLDTYIRSDRRLGKVELRYVRDRYDGAVAETNWRVRDFLRALNEVPMLYDDTLFVVAGLRGVELGEHFADKSTRTKERFGHDVLLETTLEIPLILRHPSSLTGRRILAEPVGLADIAPTLYDWFELDPRRLRGGRSLLALTDSYIERSFDTQSPLACLGGAVPSVSIGDGVWRATWNSQPPTATLHQVSRDARQDSDLSEERPDELRGWAFEARRQLPSAGQAGEILRRVLEVSTRPQTE